MSVGDGAPRHSLNDVDLFVVPSDVLRGTIAALREAGQESREAFVLWGGIFRSEREFEFRSAVRPAQTSMATEDGLLVYVDGEALFRVNRELYERGETLAAQVHSHPGEAYHSETDDAFPMMTLVGGLSIVVPAFGRSANPSEWVIYRLRAVGEWQLIDDRERQVIFS